MKRRKGGEDMKTEKYQVIGAVSQWAMIDFGLSLIKTKRVLQAVNFANGVHAYQWLRGFKTRAEAERFVVRCNTALAFQSGRLGRWITPTFVVV